MKNKIVNYYVGMPPKGGNMPRVFSSPVSIPTDVAFNLLNKQLERNGKELINGNLLHVCFDVDSEVIYLPDVSKFPQETLTPLLQAAKIKISKDHGGYAGRPPVEGSPFSSLRVRSLSSFPYANKMIGEHHKGKVHSISNIKKYRE